MKGMRDSRVAICVTRARSATSCTEFEASMAHPVERQAITSEWSPKIDSAWVARVRAVTCMVAGVNSPAILNMLGIISNKPWEAVKVVPKAPACSAPCSAPAAPPSLCSSSTTGNAPQIFFFPSERH
jgi:hypothetical protein